MKKYLLSLKIVGMIVLLVLGGSYTLKAYGEEQIIMQGSVVVDSVPSEFTDTSTSLEPTTESTTTSSTTASSDSKEIVDKTGTSKETDIKPEKKNETLVNSNQMNQLILITSNDNNKVSTSKKAQIPKTSYPKTGENVCQTLFISGIGVLLLTNCFSYIVYIRKKENK